MQEKEKTAIIIGAGPAGLTAAYELLERTHIHPIVFEASKDLGGLAKTVHYKGNRMDIGGHRFFSKSNRIMEWWQNILPIQGVPIKDDFRKTIEYQGKKRSIEFSPNGPDPNKEDRVMLLRKRFSEMYFLRSFFQYPLALNFKTLSLLGWIQSLKIGMSYVRARLFPIKSEKNLEDFYINRFGQKLYTLFFRDYTFKVWGVSPKEIRAEWGAQRVKGLSISKAVFHAIKHFPIFSSLFAKKGVETSLIDQFLYPKYGPGQMWEEVGRKVQEKGGKIFLEQRVVEIQFSLNNTITVIVENMENHKKIAVEGDYLFSTMPVKHLIRAIGSTVPQNIQKIAEGLQYRDFIMVGLLITKMTLRDSKNVITKTGIIPDNWIYIQESDVQIGRLQIFNNWSPYLLKDPENTIWLGLEYFCNEGDELWNASDQEMIQLGAMELEKIGLIQKKDVLDGVVEHVPKTYPAYTGSFDQFDSIREFTDSIPNLFLVGRNGMHRYNNMDHSMLTAMTAVDNIVVGRKDKSNIWEVNTEEEYHEEKNT